MSSDKKVTTEMTMVLPKADVEKYNAWMAAEAVDCAANGIPRNSTVRVWTVDFGDGYEVDLKVCSSGRNEDVWCEAVLFLNGSECSCTDAESDLLGDWKLEDGLDTTFIVHVVAGESEVS